MLWTYIENDCESCENIFSRHGECDDWSWMTLFESLENL